MKFNWLCQGCAECRISMSHLFSPSHQKILVKNMLKSLFTVSRQRLATTIQSLPLHHQDYLDADSLPLLKPSVKVYQENGFYKHKDWSPIGVTEQFLNNAETYQERYFNRLDFQILIDWILDLAEIDRTPSLSVLDIGSGGGSSVFALAKCLPNAIITASDISPQLLGNLAAFIDNRDELKGRVYAYCFDIHLPFFQDEVFDLIVGSAILHHLVDPFAALVNVASSLKPGGKIVLIEPMEAGCLLLTVIYEQVLEFFQKRGEMTHPIADLMRAMRTDIHARLGVPQQNYWTKYLDDKWIFNKTYLAQLTEQLGLSKVQVFPNQTNLTHVFEESFRSLLSDSGNTGIQIHEEVIEIFRKFDEGIHPDLKERLCPTGIILITK